MKHVFHAALLSIVVCASLVGCAKKDDSKPTKLVMATEATFPPYEFREGDKIVGIDVDIAGAIAKELGRELVELAGDFGGRHAGVELEHDAGLLDAAAEVAQGLGELLLARDLHRDVELPANARTGLEQRDLVPALGGCGGEGQARGAGADDGKLFRRRRLRDDQFGFMAGARID